jgi:hypothetical protein
VQSWTWAALYQSVRRHEGQSLYLEETSTMCRSKAFKKGHGVQDTATWKKKHLNDEPCVLCEEVSYRAPRLIPQFHRAPLLAEGLLDGVTDQFVQMRDELWGSGSNAPRLVVRVERPLAWPRISARQPGKPNG